MIWLVFSTIAIIINKFVFHYSIADKGSLLLQLIYGIWIFSFMSIPVKAYNEYCDKKDAEKAAQKEQQKASEKVQNYLDAFDLCDYEEREILMHFYYSQTTSINIKNVAVVRAMRNKGIDIFSFEGAFSDSGKALTTQAGLEIITKYFNKRKPEFFTLMNNLTPKEVKLLEDFVFNNDEQIELYKKEFKTAKSIINKFKNANFDDIYIDTEEFFTISTLYLAYLVQYFESNKTNLSPSK